MTARDSNSGFMKHLLDLIDDSGVSDRHLSLIATGSPDTLRTIRGGSIPRLDTLEALCRIFGLRLELVPLDESEPTSEGVTGVETDPQWASQLRKEIRQDLVEILGRAGKYRHAEAN